MKRIKWIEDSRVSMTKGKIYDVIKESHGCYYIINNLGEDDFWDKARFEEVKSEKPKTFVILGKPLHLEAFYEDLLELGYKSVIKASGRAFTFIANDEGNSLKNFKNTGLYSIDKRNIKPNNTIFNLPQDYQKALDYAKEALNPENWEEQEEVIKIGQYPAKFIGNTVTFGCKTGITLEEAQALKTVFILSSRLGNITFEREDNLYIDGNEIEISTLDKVIQKLKEK